MPTRTGLLFRALLKLLLLLMTNQPPLHLFKDLDIGRHWFSIRFVYRHWIHSDRRFDCRILIPCLDSFIGVEAALVRWPGCHGIGRLVRSRPNFHLLLRLLGRCVVLSGVPLSLRQELTLARSKALVSLTSLGELLSSSHQPCITHLLSLARDWPLVFWAVGPVGSVARIAYIADVVLTLVGALCFLWWNWGRLGLEFA